MKKSISCVLITTMVISLSGVAFAKENIDYNIKEVSTVYVKANERPMDDCNLSVNASKNFYGSFKEADTVYVAPTLDMLDNATSPAGALPARAEDMVESSQTVDEYVPEVENTETRARWVYLDDKYKVYSQANSYYCGPASVQAALAYLNDGDAPSQSSIAKGCETDSSGTYLSDMKTYINSQQSKRKYSTKYGASSSTMEYKLYNDVAFFDAVPVIGLSFSSSDGWLYSTGGHFMTVYGAVTDRSRFALGDPWIGYSGSGLTDYSWTYSKSSSTIYDAYSNENLGLMY